MSNLVEVAISEGVATLTLNNPPLDLNSIAMTEAIAAAVSRLRADDAVKVLVLTGAGDKAFCAGSDIKELRRMRDSGTPVEVKLQLENDTFTAVDKFPKATICHLNGLAYGGGLELAVCCDLLVAEEQISVGLPEILLGTYPGSGGTIRVPQRIGEGRAKQMVYLGEPISAQTALDWGLVNYVVPRGTGAAFTRELALKLARRAVNSIGLAKQSIDDSFHHADADTIPRLMEGQRQAFQHPNAVEGMMAFVEKRPPHFDRD